MQTRIKKPLPKHLRRAKTPKPESSGSTKFSPSSCSACNNSVLSFSCLRLSILTPKRILSFSWSTFVLTSHHNEHESQQIGKLEEQVGVEPEEVVVADAVVHPRAVVVKAFDAFVADHAVEASWSVYDTTSWAETSRVKSFHQGHEVESRILFE